MEGGPRPPRDERAALYRDPSWRDRARPTTLAAWAHRWSKIDVEETNTHHDLVGAKLDRLAEDRGTTPFDLMLDLALDRRAGHTFPGRHGQRRRRRDR